MLTYRKKGSRNPLVDKLCNYTAKTKYTSLRGGQNENRIKFLQFIPSN
ncbi:hypothetical protein J2S14_001958 [Lederbergia wuyishanensis]|uniref:Ribosomal protein L33 n=1 Tax=Lederbergia wuyishanensis TaxID=1347903 RepID=A0ABU0D429_9BACI|nr:hypothetical protein [Lederbergia wuyishanensis]